MTREEKIIRALTVRLRSFTVTQPIDAQAECEDVLNEAFAYIAEKFKERTKNPDSSPDDENPQGHA